MKAAPSGRGFLAGSLSLAGLASLRVVVVVVAAAVVGVIITLETVMPGTAMATAATATATAKVTVMATVTVTVMATVMEAHRQRQLLTGLTSPLSPT